ncbi:hypothetical protein G7Y31_04805 [Corynebacterium lizhenjunii]|uniref:Uncharacterized protein n=1 Tax=Corynebacterium lizhenjunii TaxID=2709394 RepID=A0A7T0KFW7_9CORY|nr:hypothetical protein [Corynebacterium lizhenjunii]QPK80015.1 hypothetical protein G7Y31_04805 [Corynebacterium lizhenjunii]
MPGSLVTIIGLPIITWGLLYARRQTTARWVFGVAVVATGFAAVLLLALLCGWDSSWIDVLSVASVAMYGVVLLMVGVKARSGSGRAGQG